VLSLIRKLQARALTQLYAVADDETRPLKERRDAYEYAEAARTGASASDLLRLWLVASKRKA
jgi:hypothetical protein